MTLPQTAAHLVWITASCLILVAGCGDDDGGGGLDAGPDADVGPSLDDFLPEVPDATGGAQSAFAGEITAAESDELIAGEAATGMVGDFYLRNSRTRFVVSAATRVIGVVPQGGNVVDAVLLDDQGEPVSDDHFGELSMIYMLGRTCEHQQVEVVRDGAGGGVAVLRARGVTAVNDFINMRGIGALPAPPELIAENEDGFACATTYVLEPDAATLKVYFTLFNGGPDQVDGPFGALNDTGGATEAWGPARGFERLGIEALTSLGDPAPVAYTLYQGPGVAYGVIPRHASPTVPNSQFLIAGVSIVLMGAEKLLDILDDDTFFLHLAPDDGMTQQVDLVIGRDAEDVDVAYRLGRGETLASISGTASFAAGGPALGARVGIYEDVDTDGQVGADDRIVSYLDVDGTGAFAGQVPAGNLLARAEVKDLSRSPAVAVATGLTLELPDPVRLDYDIIDDATGGPIPARLLVVGVHPVSPDPRLFETHDRLAGVVVSAHAVRGTTTDLGDGADPQLVLPGGGTYRIYASRGTEWSVASQRVVADGATTEVTLGLRRVVPTEGYLSSEWHVHQIGSPDSPVPGEVRIASAVSAGIELFAVTDHDFVADLQPRVEAAGLDEQLRVIPGIEVTPFAYGHFNAWPMDIDATSPNRGAVDWARGTAGFAMTPGEIFAAMRERGARLVQVNHPRSGGGIAFQEFFDRAAVTYDYDTRTIFGDFDDAPVPNRYLRLPEASLWDDSFNALEVWNGFGTEDTDLDGRVEIASLDRVMRDWFNFLSFGMAVVPCGNSDTHTSIADAMGMPRTFVRVPDDSGAALASGEAALDAVDTLAGTEARDVVVTNAPMIAVTSGGQPAIGRVIAATDDTVTLTVTVTSPDWAEIDTLEIFANATPASPAAVTALQPVACWTTRAAEDLAASDPCALAPVPVAALDVDTVAVGTAARLQATVTITLQASQIPARAGATGSDAWLVLRARGDRAIFPLLSGGVLTDATAATFVEGNPTAIDALLRGAGVPATGFTAPIYVDFDGGGYTAPFAP